MPDPEVTTTAAPVGFLARVPIVALRMVQFAVDLALLALITLVPTALILLLLPRNPDDTLGQLLVAIPVILALLVLSVVISWWYWARLPRRRGGQTLAMRWLGLRVVRLDGREPTGGQLALRWLLLFVDAMFFGAVGAIAMLLSAQHQRLGDWFADTLVVRDVT